MMGFWIALVLLIGVSVSPALAQLYRWTDDTGRVHITDNPETIPPAYRERARSSSPETPSPASDPDTPSVTPSPPSPAPASRPAPARGSSAQATQQIQQVQQQISAARRERQTYLNQLRNERTVHATPEFVRQRRQIAETGRALLTVERRLDALDAELERAQRQARQAPPIAQSDVGLDHAGRDAVYWQRRLDGARDRLRQARAQRRDILARLATAAGGGERAAAGQARLILEHAEALHQAVQAIDTAEAAIQTLRQEALQAGAPAAWLQ